MPDFDLQIALDRLAESLLPDDEIRQQRANAAVISHDGGVHSRPLVQSLPWYRVDMSIPGEAVAESDVRRLAFPQGAIIRHLSVYARTPPGTTYTLRLAATASSQRFSLQPGQQTAMRGASIRVDPSGWLTVDVTNAGGAADIFISIHYTPLGGA